MAHPSNPVGVRFAGGAVALGFALICTLTTLVAAPAVAAPTPVPDDPSPAASSASPQPTASASTSYAKQPDEFALMISPTRLVVGAKDAGTTQKISVINRGRAPVAVLAEKRNFTAAPDGSLHYDQDSPYGADRWVRLAPTSFTIPPGAVQVVTADVSMPEKLDAGDHQVAVVFMVPSTAGKGNIHVNRGLAAPMYITAPGPVDSTVALTALHAPRLVAWGPVDLTATLQNQGTVHRDFRGTTALHVQAAGSPATFPDFTVPRGAARDVAAQWKPPLLCVCHVRVGFDNTGGVEQSLTTRVVVFPWPVALGLVVVVLALLLLRQHRRRRRHDRRPTRRGPVAARALTGTEDG